MFTYTARAKGAGDADAYYSRKADQSYMASAKIQSKYTPTKDDREAISSAKREAKRRRREVQKAEIKWKLLGRIGKVDSRWVNKNWLSYLLGRFGEKDFEKLFLDYANNWGFDGPKVLNQLFDDDWWADVDGPVKLEKCGLTCSKKDQ